MVVIILFVLTANLFLDRPVMQSLLFAVALAVGLSPELLPAIISVTLSTGARTMSNHGVIVRRLDAIENLGSMDILCTDKTGTLTEGTMILKECLDSEGRQSEVLLQLAFLNSSFETGIENPLDQAIVKAGNAMKLTNKGFIKIDEIPYDFIRRRLTIVVAQENIPEEHQLIIKGAFSNVLDICTSFKRDGKQFQLDQQAREEFEEAFKSLSADGFRVLAIATRSIQKEESYHRDDEKEMTFRGFLVFQDPAKPEAKRAIHDLSLLGIRIKIISGDNRYVTSHLAEAVGLNPNSILTGEQLASMKDEALWHLAPKTEIFVEIDPQQKERIVRALQRTGHSVGYLGDGINDVPAIHAADVGISVEGAVDVARESADIILLSRDLDVLRTGVAEGRRTFANTIKYILITTSANFGNMISMALVVPLMPFMPLTAKQILLNNFCSDLSSVAISTDNVDHEHMTKPQRWDIREIRKFMVVFGLVSSLFDFLTFCILLLILKANEATFQTSWFMISLLTELAVVLVLRTRRPCFKSKPSSMLICASVIMIITAFVIPYLGKLAEVFSFIALSTGYLLIILLIVFGYILTTELVKTWYFRAGRHC